MDKRYLTVKRLVEGGYIQLFSEIFDHIPKSVVAKDLGFNYNRLSNLIINVDGWILKDIYSLSKLFAMDEMAMISLVYQQHKVKKKPEKKSKPV